ncbi:AGE family epimerase/isomerase [Mesorhizobium sp. BE184]|uniref:AGE family epimerase/isomerase n=1 Tax=Mesorhizobium sp. BE184 TaxID=2817714 RepID=UPI0028546EC7|nr:AGE family epimerase/isomerase [Mesorhizobium sp. BE184]MDR7034950.1 mannose/cellobiose epimerase-like protein (N-acyl-D-glucosamine 2-epimerase family) [Mesorhizobium sp. BE184]
MASQGSQQSWVGTGGPRFVQRPAHRRWLLGQAMGLLDFFHYRAFNPAGGFSPLDDAGLPFPAKDGRGVERQIHDTTRTVHCFAIAHLLGLPGADRMIDHGMDFLWKRHRDADRGGYFWGVDDEKATNPTKQAYGHAFVLLAASSAKVVGHPDADRLLADVSDVLNNRFWEADVGATSEEYAADWSPLGNYRGQNSNMHLTEALMAAYEATDDRAYLAMAESIASLIIGRHAREQDWRVAEHFTEDWQVDLDYEGDPTFRPAGTTPGHALEWSRLLVQLWSLGNRKHDWLIDAARQLFFKTVSIGWDKAAGGFYYTLDWQDRPARSDRFWWPCAEGIGAAAVLGAVDPDPRFEEWYRRIWDFSANHLIDHDNGGWFPELDSDLKPVNRVFRGKPDLYHALQACLIPLLPADGSITRGLLKGLPVGDGA